jgi:GAF domain-containing protein
MLREDTPVGTLTVARREKMLFSENQIALLKTFAAQAAIAVENVRLFQELQARTGELGRSVEQLKALGEVGQAVSSTLNLETVLATIVARAVELSGTTGGAVYEYDEATQEFHLRVAHQMGDDLVEAIRAAPIRLGEGAVGRAAAVRAPVQVPDVLDEHEYGLARLRPILARLEYRSLLAVPFRPPPSRTARAAGRESRCTGLRPPSCFRSSAGSRGVLLRQKDIAKRFGTGLAKGHWHFGGG